MKKKKGDIIYNSSNPQDYKISKNIFINISK